MQTIDVLRALSDAFANAAAQLDQAPVAGESPLLPGAAAAPLPGAVTPPLPGTAAAVPLPGTAAAPLPGAAAATPPAVSQDDLSNAFMELYQKAGPQVAQRCLTEQLRVQRVSEVPEISRPQALQIIKQNMPAGA